MAFKIFGTIYDLDEKLLRDAANEAFLYLGGEFEVNLKFVSQEEIRELNKTYRNKDSVTDVLSFGVDPGQPGGDIVIYYEELQRDAKEWELTTSEAGAFLLVHGILHLSDYDHTNAEDRAKMEKAEEEILSKVGVSLKQ